MSKPTLKQAIAGTLRTWRAVLELAEQGKWQEAERRRKRSGWCLFCQMFRGETPFFGFGEACKACPLNCLLWCQRTWYWTPYAVLWGWIEPSVGLRRLRSIVRTLERMREEKGRTPGRATDGLR